MAETNTPTRGYQGQLGIKHIELESGVILAERRVKNTAAEDYRLHLFYHGQVSRSGFQVGCSATTDGWNSARDIEVPGSPFLTQCRAAFSLNVFA